MSLTLLLSKKQICKSVLAPVCLRLARYSTQESEYFYADDNTFSRIVEQHPSPVIVDFFAQWCGPCKAIAPLLKKIAPELGLRLVKVDIDEAQQTAEKYKVTALPTVAVFNKGKVVDQFVGMRKAEEIKEFVEQSIKGIDNKSDTK